MTTASPVNPVRPVAHATVVCVGNSAFAVQMLGRWAQTRADSERWVIMIDAGASVQAAAFASSGLPVLPLAGGCICCIGAIGLRVALARVLREYRPDRVFLLPATTARIPLLIDALRASLAASALLIDSIIDLPTVDDHGRLRVSPGTSLAVLPDAQTQQGKTHEAADCLSRDIAAVTARASGRWPSPVILPGRVCGEWNDALRAASEPVDQARLLRWSAQVVFERSRLLAVLAQLLERQPGLSLHGVFRTAREWYEWDSSQPGELLVSHWRLDSRLTFESEQKSNLADLQALHARLGMVLSQAHFSFELPLEANRADTI